MFAFGSSPPCSSPPFSPWVVAAVLVAAVHAVGRRCWQLCAAGHVWLLSWLVAGATPGFRGRALCWSLEGSWFAVAAAF